MADHLAMRTEGTISDENLGRSLLDRRLLTNEKVLVAQRHAQEQSISLRQAILDLHLLPPEELDIVAAKRSSEQLQEEARRAEDQKEQARDDQAEGKEAVAEGVNLERDLRAELGEIAATAVPSDLVEQMLQRALVARSTDVHIDPLTGYYQVRFRIDGQLHQMVELDTETGQAVVRGIKILANMNIVEHRLPQDGALAIRREGRAHNVRVSTLPTSEGEKVVLRILEPMSIDYDLDALGLEPEQAALVNQFLARPYGAMLVGGPVGAGKTTTLYSCLHRVNHPNQNVVTIEDPIEYRFSGVNQVEIDGRVGLSFAKGLRAILRQDPDVLMIGEIRDEETAAIGMRAALTGVLVFSTIHASDAAGTISTLFNYGIPSFTLAHALQGVINQRLVRTICPHCRAGYEADATVLKALRLDPDEHMGLTLYRGAGCSACFHSGYIGRTGIFEVMNVSLLLRELILMQTTKDVIGQVARDEGMKTLREAAITKVIEGKTTVEEMYRVTM